MESKTKEAVKQFLKEHNTMSLATSYGNSPYAASLFYASDGFVLYFFSRPESRHVINILLNPDVAATINKDYMEWRIIKGLQIRGKACKVSHGLFRTGKSHTSRGVKGFIYECLKMIPDDIREIYLRADSGFYDFDFMDYLEQKGIRYTIVVKLYPWIQMELVRLNYRDISGGLSVGEMWYTGIGWKEPRRMVVIREQEREYKRRKKQPTLFERMGYSYQVIVTNIEEMSPEELWRFYNGRANVENMVKEGIMSYSLDVNISHFYGANVAHFHLVMLAYNLMNLFKEYVLGQKDKKRMAKWIRQRIFLIAGKLIKSGRKFILKLQEYWAYKEEYNKAERRIGAIVWIT